MEITNTVEHEDGSATFTFDMSPEEQIAFLRYGIISALKAGIEEAKKWEPVDEKD